MKKYLVVRYLSCASIDSLRTRFPFLSCLDLQETRIQVHSFYDVMNASLCTNESKLQLKKVSFFISDLTFVKDRVFLETYSTTLYSQACSWWKDSNLIDFYCPSYKDTNRFVIELDWKVTRKQINVINDLIESKPQLLTFDEEVVIPIL